MKLRWTDRARRDLQGIRRFIARDKPMAARQWVDRLRHRARTAAESPSAGRIVAELGREDIREVLVGNYRVVYLVGGDTVDVLTVFEGHRLLDRGDL
jgi:plasmid stabilization system protein ParE